MQQPTQKRKITGITIIVAIVVAAVVFLYLNNRKPPIDKYLADWATAMNAQCPMPVDNVTQLDNVHVSGDEQLMYNYTVTGFAKEEMDVKLIQEVMHQQILSNISTNPDMQTLRDYGVNFVYNYKDKNGAFLFSETITPKNYRKK
jgi:hypothetical protein